MCSVTWFRSVVVAWAMTLLAGASHAADWPVLTSPNARSWEGFLVELGVTRPLNSQVLITDGGNVHYGTFNLTGIHATAVAAYLFQRGFFVFGPRLNLTGGLVESMPLDFTVRTNLFAGGGAEAGIAFSDLYVFAFAVGGFGWLSAERIDVAAAHNIVPAYEVGGGVRWKFARDWFAMATATYVTLGDQRLRTNYLDPKPYASVTLGFGAQFFPY
jgi:hypothetical protein